MDFSNLINSSLDVGFTLNNILLTLFGKLLTTRGIIAMKGNDGILEPKLVKGIPSERINDFPKESLIDGELSERLKRFLADNKLVYTQKLISHNGVIGIIALGSKLTNMPYSESDMEFIGTIANTGATAIENSLTVEKIKTINKELDSKVNRLSALFDLSKEFSGALEVGTVNKLLVYSIIGQMLVSKYAILSAAADKPQILDSKFPEENVLKFLDENPFEKIDAPISCDEIKEIFPSIADVGIELILPMRIKNKTKGLILLGARGNKLPYLKSDIEFVSSLGSLAIISIENALLFEEALEKEKLEKELETARKIQKSLLPNKIPVYEEYKIAAVNNSAKQVGGDYYDILELDSDRTLIAIGDVSGKGVQAALLMANVQAFLKSIWKQNITLDKASNLINDLVSENTTDGSFITFFWGIINRKEMKLEYVNAGHNPPLLCRNGEIEHLKKGGMILGVMQTIIPYEAAEIKLQSGDVLVAFTDGITEAMNVNFEEYSDERLEKLALSNCDKTADDLLNVIMNDVMKHTVGAVQSDDITALVLKIK
ncbi:MAG: SpoIIE family protein phosphatase [Chlorobi bacterium]|nr:SpoIIE family protein phosphatase [Chlorobiota bacterium]